MRPVIAIDGPAGVGKSTIAIALAREFELTYVETGAMYRAVALRAREEGIAFDDAPALAEVAHGLGIRFELVGDVNHVYLGDRDVTADLRAPDMGPLASQVSSVPEVRSALLDVQRDFGRAGGAVAEGRDIGTVVFPAADFKFFLVADVKERARRRHLQLKEAGRDVPVAELEAEIAQRDEADSGRAVAPLKAADDAILVDTTHLDVEGVLEELRARVRATPNPEPRTPNPAFRSGFVSLVGRPNVGKSTLMNTILGTKLAIVSPKPQTTRNKITGIATWEDCQMVFLDTPGIHETRGGRLNRLMVEVAYSSLEDADAVCFLVDVAEESKRRPVSEGNRVILEKLRGAGKPVILVLNKVDLVKKHLLLPLIDAYRQAMEFAAILPTSATQGQGVPELLDELRALMPVGEAFYPDGTLTDRSRDFIITEYIREKIYLLTRQEIPYSTAVSIDQVTEMDPPPGKDRPGLLHVVASIHVERASQKGMLIGKQGRMVKEIGRQARLDLKEYLKRKVHLDLHIRVEKDWTRSLKGIKKVGFDT